MPTKTVAPLVESFDLTSETAWRNLIFVLGPYARALVYSFHVPSWKGQEEDVIEDILQESAKRLLERIQKAERGEAEPIRSLHQMITVVAQNYCKDLRRRERRLVRMQQADYERDTRMHNGDQPHLFDAICDCIDQENLLTQVAREIANFPKKQREALLIDLANRMFFGPRPTLLQKAFLGAGIQLECYCRSLPSGTRERKQHASLLICATRRVSQLSCVQEYMS
jgi:DNA-directed RNA polymerase specialized sigma24 family protein